MCPDVEQVELSEAPNVENDQWTWACPYCGASNDLDAQKCVSCGSQLRDPDEDDLFGTVATENAQVVDPGAALYQETVWSTEAPSDDVIDVEAEDPEPEEPVRPSGGPFSATQQKKETKDEVASANVFGASPSSAGDAAADAPLGRNPFSPPQVSGTGQPGTGQPGTGHPGTVPPGPAPSVGPFEQPYIAPQQPPMAAPQMPQPGIQASAGPAPDPFAGAPGMPSERTLRPTPDSFGLAAAVEALGVAERERCAVPIAVCGALLREGETVLAAVAGQLLGHSAVVVLTTERAIIANSRRWRPLVDVFVPEPNLHVHSRHDSEVASLTFLQGDRLTGVDNITNVSAALGLAEKMMEMSQRDQA